MGEVKDTSLVLPKYQFSGKMEASGGNKV